MSRGGRWAARLGRKRGRGGGGSALAASEMVRRVHLPRASLKGSTSSVMCVHSPVCVSYTFISCARYRSRADTERDENSKIHA